MLSHHGIARLTGDALVAGARAADVVVTSYDIATRDIETLALVEWDRLLLDEAQDMKNPATKRARALRRLSARRRVAMTGTPIENRLGELWAIMDIVNPGLLGSRESFDRTFARPIEAYGDEKALERLRGDRAAVRPAAREGRPGGRARAAADHDRQGLLQADGRAGEPLPGDGRPLDAADRGAAASSFGQRGSVLAMLSQLKRVCNHPELLLATGQPLEGRSGKLDRLVELLEQVPAGDKALVFTQYPGFDRLVPYLARAARHARSASSTDG